VIITKNDWLDEYKKIMETKEFNYIFDALGGGHITESLLKELPEYSRIDLYGRLENKEPFTIDHIDKLAKGVVITGFRVV
jgi:hypothetical protein